MNSKTVHRKFLTKSVMSAFVLSSLCLSAMITTTDAADIYFAQNSTGADTGADCTNAHALTWFNSTVNWANPKQSGKIGPNDTAHFCGSVATTATIQASGSPGAPITLQFEPGAKFSSAVWSNATGAINTNKKNYVTINGGVDGVIENTDNGTLLGHKTNSIGILASGSSYLEIKNLHISNIYVHTSVSDSIGYAADGAIYWQGIQSNVSVHDCVIHDVHWALNYQFGYGSCDGFAIYNNDIYNTDHGVGMGGYGANSVTNITIYNNHFHDYANWDTTANTYHHDGIHIYANGGAHANLGKIYNNIFDGDTGVNFTSHIFLEKDGETNNDWKIFNNVFLPPPQGKGAGFGFIALGANTGTEVYNNTLQGGCKSVSGCYGILVAGGNTKVKNNIISGFNTGIVFYTAAPGTTWDNNLYADITKFGATVSPYGEYSTLASWKSYLQSLNSSNEVHAVSATNALLGTSGIPQANSPATGAGVNLTGVGIPALDFDKNQVARPGSGAWVIGAFTGAVPVIFLPAPVLLQPN